MTPLPAGDVEIDLRDEHQPVVVAAPVRPRLRRRVFAAARRSLPVAGWLAVFVLIGVLFLPTVLGFSRYAIVGGSMSPTFDRGSAVFSQPEPVSALQVGDIITYLPPPDAGIDTLVTHRISDISEAESGELLFRTKGDANEEADPWTFSLDAETQNVVRFSVPYLGTVLTRLADPDLRRIAIGVPAGVIALGAVMELFGIAPLREQLARRRTTPA